jgi:hypothetical protein
MVLIAGCAVIAKRHLDEIYGPQSVVDHSIDAPAVTISSSDDPQEVPEYYHDVKSIVDSRCAVCHGCYDAPCQLKMTSFEGIDRGANKEKIYNGKRLLAGNLTRFSIDAKSTQQWREQDFFPVLNERIQTPEANTQASVMHRILQLKTAHPLPEGEILPASFDFSLDRKQECSKIEEFDQFEENKPLWGMPYGLPAIETDQQAMLEAWLEHGAKVDYFYPVQATNQIVVDSWEDFLNGSSLKQKLMSRYIYEHLFLANIYFSSSFSGVGEQRQFFKLVRSTTPPGAAIEVIASRRPFDAPGNKFFYRLQRLKTTVLAKRHMPYKFDQQRMDRWTELFLTPQYAVSELPSYDPVLASNPFVTFKDIPVNARYRFMLDEAQFTIMGYIKGPVCRGQVALNVINDHFWVVFTDPDSEIKYSTGEFLAREAIDLRLPAEQGSTALNPLSAWLKYSAREKRFIDAREKRFSDIISVDEKLTLAHLWDGDGDNRNAALTIFRHFDSSSVIKGLVGDTPKTAWVISYPLLERIHYLLVAGFDVYGNVGHQLLTRLYMDFLRMEGEATFLKFFPNEYAKQQLDLWYRGEESQVDEYLTALNNRDFEASGMNYKTDNPKKEFFELFRTNVGEKVVELDPINTLPKLAVSANYQSSLQRLSRVEGVILETIPEQSLLRLKLKSGNYRLISLIRNRAHLNVSHLFGEQKRFVPEEQTLSVVDDVVGTYPNIFFDVHESELENFVDQVSMIKSEQDYAVLVDRFGVRRTNKDFWRFSDSVHDTYMNSHPVDAGYLDFNRLENR